jgi:hypothetical protein
MTADLDYAVLTSPRQELQLLPRYRRVLTFGDVLDESVQVFRQHWVSFALLSAVSLLPPGLIGVWLSASGTFGPTVSVGQLQTGRIELTPTILTEMVALSAIAIISTLFALLWTAAIVGASDAFLHGAEPRLGPVYAHALRRYASLFGAVLVVGFALVLLTTVATALFVLTGFGIGGSLIALVGVLFWWLKPDARRTWLKWLIVVVAPFGLPAYLLGLWSMFVPAAVLECHGPLGSLRRSTQLVDRHWFRVVSTLTVASLIVAILEWAPVTLIEIPLTISTAARGRLGLAPTEAAIVNAVGVALQVLFASIGAIVYTLVFVDLRNRHEATDILERVSELETEATLLTNG